ncbi:MAG: MFS transporter [Oscillospiraceae bacterium]|jgi:MFS family permease|nr:MFS transporter [Oscillospiraceae bacterium]
MPTTPNYRATVRACYLGNLLQSCGAIFAILFVPLRTLYGLTYTQYGLLVSVNFIVQVCSDILFSKPVERLGFRPFAVLSPILTSTGLVLFALAPVLFPGNVFFGFCVGMFVFAAAAGLQELLLSPILDGVPMPEEKKKKAMSLLHSFFAWGQIGAVLITTLLVWVLKAEQWQLITVLWALPPLVNVFLFAKAPLDAKVSAGNAMSLKQLFTSKIFLVVLLAIIFGGAAEVTMSQWASAFIEKGLNLPKLLGDMLGVCGFSLMLGLGRTLYGLKGDSISIHKVMIFGSLGAFCLYLLAALSGSPFVGMAACGLTGFCVSMLWPGSIVVASRELPLAGASMFALMSAGGDLGSSAASFLTGQVADRVEAMGLTSFMGSAVTPEQAALRAGLFFAALFPICCFGINILLQWMTEKKQKGEKS